MQTNQSNPQDDLMNIEPSTADLKVVMIIPLGAPVPTEFTGEDPETGSLYQRLAPLANEHVDQPTLVAMSGTEMLALERVWKLLVLAKRVVYLTELPGAIYDVTFTASAKLLGLPSVTWPDYADRVAAMRIESQRTRDRNPWVADDAARDRRLRTPTTTSASGARLDPPETFDETDA